MTHESKPPMFSPEVRELAVRMVFEHGADYPSQWAAYCTPVHTIHQAGPLQRAMINRLALHRAGQADKNRYLESLKGKLRDECLNKHVFSSLAEARRIIEAWRVDYNEVRPHSSLACQTPEVFAAAWLERQGDNIAPNASPCHRALDPQGQACGALRTSLTVPARDGLTDVRPDGRMAPRGPNKRMTLQTRPRTD